MAYAIGSPNYGGGGGGGGGGGAPSGPAGGDLGGTYPNPTVVSVADVTTGVLPVANGGTNSSTALNNNRNIISSAGALVEQAAMTDGQVIVGKTGSAPQIVTAGGDVASVSNAGVIVVTKTNGVSFAASATTDATNATNISSGTLANSRLSGVTLANGTVAFTGDQSMGSHKLTNVTDPAALQDAATKNYVDQVAGGLAAKSARLATASGLPTYNYVNGVAGVGATITATAFGALTVDGSAVVVADRVLVKNETAGNAPFNGIYIVTATGGGAAFYILTRAVDSDDSDDFASVLVLIQTGTANANTSWICTNAAAVNVGTDAITFSQYQIGQGTTMSGNVTGTVGNNTLASGSASVLNSGTLPAARLPALTGDVTSSAGSAATYLFGQTNLISPTLTAAQNDWNPTGLATANTIRVTQTTGYFDLTGLQGGTEGRLLYLENAAASTFPIRMTANDAGSSAANRFGFSANLFLAPGEGIELLYDGTSSLWRLIKPAPIPLSQYYGDGLDGTVTISSGTTTLTRDFYYQNLTMSGTGVLNCAGFHVYVSEMLDLSAAQAGAIIGPNATAGSNGANAGTLGGGGAGAVINAASTLVTGSTTGQNGGAGTTTNGANGTNAGAANVFTANNGGNAGAGGTGSAGTAGTAGTTGTATQRVIPRKFLDNLLDPMNNTYRGGLAGGGGGGGGGDNTTAGGGGGGGGGGASIMWLSARFINRGSNATANIIQCNGANGGNGGSPAGGNTGGGGGGGASSGGVIFVFYGYVFGSTITNAIQAASGAGGTGGTHQGTGTDGGGGQSGAGGQIVVNNITTSTTTVTIGAAKNNAAGTTGGAAVNTRVNL